MKLGAGWIRKAAEGDQNSPGLSSAQLDLGRYYQYGEGVSPDHEEAMKWYLKAAQEGHNVGIRFYFGIGVMKDLAQGLMWIYKAEQNGSTQAARFLQHMRGQ